MNLFRYSDTLFYSIIGVIVATALIGTGVTLTIKSNSTSYPQQINEVYEPVSNNIEKDTGKNNLMEIFQKYAYRNAKNENSVPIDFNPRECLFKVGGICFGRPFFAKGMSYMDCKANKDDLGIEYCKDSNDIFAATALVCGGTRNMPTLDELVILANDMYVNGNFRNLVQPVCPVDAHGGLGREKAERVNSKTYLDYFRYIYSDDTNFYNEEEENARKNLTISILSNKETNDYAISGRVFENKDTHLDMYISKLKSSYYPIPFSMCVDRANSTPLNVQYPIKYITTEEEEAERELF